MSAPIRCWAALSIGRCTNLDLPPEVRTLLRYLERAGVGVNGTPPVLRVCLSVPNPSLQGVKIPLKAMGQFYEIVSIEPAEPPPGGKGSYWYHYVIAFEGSITITGCRAGSLNAVTSGVVEMIAQLNDRHFKKRGRADLVL